MNNIVAATPPHVAVLAFPYGTHAAPLHAIIRHLATLSPQTHFTFLSTARSNAALFTSNAPSNLLRRDIPEPPSEGRVHYLVTADFLSTSEEVFRKEVEVVEMEVGMKVTCLVTDAFYGFAAEMAAAMGVGWVAFWTAGTASLSAHFHTDLIRDKIGITDPAGRQSDMLDFIPGLSKIRVQDLPGEVFGDLEKAINKALHQMARALPRATAVFINSFEALDPTITADLGSKFHQFLNVGPLNLILKQPASLDIHECLPWLDTREANSVAYISFGSVTCPPPHELAALLHALEESQIPYLWSLKEKFLVHLPEGFLDRTSELGKIVPWAPQVDILAHSSVGVFITHCGWNSVLEGVISGVPMIGRPSFGDQKINARAITTVFQIGSVVEGGIVTKGGLMEIMEVILKGKEGQSMRERAEELEKAAKEAVEENGSSVRNMKLLLEQITEVSK